MTPARITERSRFGTLPEELGLVAREMIVRLELLLLHQVELLVGQLGRGDLELLAGAAEQRLEHEQVGRRSPTRAGAGRRRSRSSGG